MSENGKIKAIGLFSGGLDSTLALRIVHDMNISVTALNVRTVFSGHEWEESFSRNEIVAKTMGIELKVLTVSDEYIEMVKHPIYGYGKNMNPCLDCHIFFCKKAREYMDETGAQFVFTGEVLGQRPMSQHRHQLRVVEKESGLEGLLLRPLSAKLLPPTIPEKNGWVDRERLLGLSGRSRKAQIELAARLGIEDYPAPAGGCLLTDIGFSERLRDLFSHQVDDINSILLLKVGRHFRVSGHSKCIVGRNESENVQVANLAQDGDYLFDAEDVGSPLCLLRGNPDEEDVHYAAALCKYYSDGREEPKIKVRAWKIPEEEIRYIVPEDLTKVQSHERIISRDKNRYT